MCAGYELCSFKPAETHLSDISKYPQVCQRIILRIIVLITSKLSIHQTEKTDAKLSVIFSSFQIVEILELIFGQEARYPSVEELLLHDLFRNIDLREMRSVPVTVKNHRA